MIHFVNASKRYSSGFDALQNVSFEMTAGEMAFLTGHSGAGKTTLLVEILKLCREQNLRAAVIKNTHHDFEIDKPGKDSYRLRHAGAVQTMLATKNRVALIIESDIASATEPSRADR